MKFIGYEVQGGCEETTVMCLRHKITSKCDNSGEAESMCL